MPIIAVERTSFLKAIERELSDEGVDALLADFGLELDEIEEEEEKDETTGEIVEKTIYKVEIPANRYDLLCVEGLTMALRVYLGIDQTPNFQVVPPEGELETMFVRPSTSPLRPFVVSAIIRDMTFEPETYDSFIELQEKLHQNICRKRTLVAIGTHDLDTIQGPFYYDCAEPESFSFVPLTASDEEPVSMTGRELLDDYRTNPNHKHLKPYTDIIYDEPSYPLIRDSNGVVLSMPPIINGKHSRITLNTRNVFIECTATDLTKAQIVLDTVVTMFSKYAAQPFSVEPVRVVYEEDGREDVTPLLTYRTVEVSCANVNSMIGVELSGDVMCSLASRMELGPCEFFPSSNQLRVTVPPTRSDVLHEVDVIEDIAIAYGYNNIRKIVPATNTVGKPLPLNHLSDLLRQEIARDGFVEVLTHGLCSIEENFELLNKNSAEFDNYVTLSNPCNMEYQMVRTSLLPGMLKTLKFNRSTSFSEGVRLFEVSDVVIKTGGAQTDAPFGLENPLDYEEIGARNERRVICCYSGPEKVFETIHGTVDRIMRVLQIAPHESYALNSMRQDQFNQVVHTSRDELCYTIQAFDDSTFFPGRCGRVVLYRLSPAGTSLDGQEPQPVGLFGILHPTVLGNYSLSFPTSVVELELEKLL